MGKRICQEKRVLQTKKGTRTRQPPKMLGICEIETSVGFSLQRGKARQRQESVVRTEFETRETEVLDPGAGAAKLC